MSRVCLWKSSKTDASLYGGYGKTGRSGFVTKRDVSGIQMVEVLGYSVELRELDWTSRKEQIISVEKHVRR